MRSTVVVVTWRGHAHLRACLTALAAQDRPHRTVVVDNASDDGTAALLTELPFDELLTLTENVGFAGGIAAALPQVSTEFMVWLNDDAVPQPGWLAALEDATTEQVGAVSGRLGDALGIRLDPHGYGYDTTEEPLFGFCGGGALVRTAALRQIGGVAAEFFCYYEDTDAAWRLRLAGWQIVAAPRAVAAHVLGASTKPGSSDFHRWNERNRVLMLMRCAPLGIVAWQMLRFCALTMKFLVRPGAALNQQAALRLRILLEIALAAPRTFTARRRIQRVISRRTLWAHWVGRAPEK